MTHWISNVEGVSYLETSVYDIESEEAIKSSFPITNPDPQKFGSAMTYGKRYNLSALLNIVSDEDDD